jgi:hypothetical protein
MRSEAGLKQVLAGLPTAEPEGPRQSGRFAIDPRREPRARETREASPPSAAEPRPEITQLLELNTLTQEELDWIAERKHHARAASPVVFAKPGEDPSHGALTPFYREPTLERVQLQFEDRSLDPSANPLALSSLLPPPRLPFATFARVMSIGAATLAVGSVAYLAAVASWGGSGPSRTVDDHARKASAPQVLTVDPSSGVVSDMSAALSAPSKPSEEVPWSVPDANPAAPAPAPAARVLPDLPPAAAPTPMTNRRRALAARARARGALNPAPALSPMAQQPSRAEIQGVIESARNALQACAGNQHGTFTARVTITGAGRVAEATIEGAFAGSPQGSCMARSLRGVVFPRFSSPSLQVSYPFRM